MSYYLKSGNTFRVTSKEAMDLHENLPASNYVIKQDMNGNLFLESINTFEIKGRTYGNLVRNRDRILNTFNDRSASTGVMLAGEKGSGKSLLAKAICARGVELGIPAIIINAPWTGDKFNAFLQCIDQPTIILFDEFEKVYDKDQQEQILTLLDGVFPSKKLFILTCNDKWRIDGHMRNRPGRIFYMIDFKGLDCNFITEYCKDNLKDTSHIERICGIASLFSEFNFDMLKALVEEMNRYNEGPEVALEMLNAKPEFDQGTINYHVDLIIQGVPVEEKDLEDKEWGGNPLTKGVEINYKKLIKATEPDEQDDWDWFQAVFEPSDLKKIDSTNSKFVFVNEKNESVVLTKIQTKQFHYYKAF